MVMWRFGFKKVSKMIEYMGSNSGRPRIILSAGFAVEIRLGLNYSELTSSPPLGWGFPEVSGVTPH